jgi:hypothetical protein
LPAADADLLVGYAAVSLLSALGPRQADVEPAIGAYPPVQLRERAQQERETLAARGAPVSFLAREVLAWAAADPAEPRIPKMLHDVIVAGRYTTGDDDSVDLLQRVFNLLHRRYQHSQWTAQTQYWYEPPESFRIVKH